MECSGCILVSRPLFCVLRFGLLELEFGVRGGVSCRLDLK